MDGLPQLRRTAPVALWPRSVQVGRARRSALSAAGSTAYRTHALLASSTPRSRCCAGGKGQPPTEISRPGLGAPTRRSRDHSKEGSSAARWTSRCARPSKCSTSPRAIAVWGLGPLHEQIPRSHEGGVVGHALGAKRVALGPLSRGRYGVASRTPHDDDGIPAPGFRRIDLHPDSWRSQRTHPGPQVGGFTARGSDSYRYSVGCCAARQ
jgi:hypothetical protein